MNKEKGVLLSSIKVVVIKFENVSANQVLGLRIARNRESIRRHTKKPK